MAGKAKNRSGSKWTRTTVLIREDHLEKFKVLAWWESTTIKDLFDKMIDQYLSSKIRVDELIEERKKAVDAKKSGLADKSAI